MTMYIEPRNNVHYFRPKQADRFIDMNLAIDTIYRSLYGEMVVGYMAFNYQKYREQWDRVTGSYGFTLMRSFQDIERIWHIYKKQAIKPRFAGDYLACSAFVPNHNHNKEILTFLDNEILVDRSGEFYFRRFPHAKRAYSRISIGTTKDIDEPVQVQPVPIIQHWQDQNVLEQPSRAGIVGVGNPNVVVGRDYYYCLYSRYTAVGSELYNPNISGYPYYGYPPYISRDILPRRLDFLDPNGEHYDPRKAAAWNRIRPNCFVPTMCIARAPKENPYQWEKLIRRYEGEPVFDGDQWIMEKPEITDIWNSAGNRDTSIMPPGRAFYGAKVTYCAAYDRYVMIGLGHGEHREIQLYWARDRGKDIRCLLDWEGPTVVETGEPVGSVAYPALIHLDWRTDKKVGYKAKLVYAAGITKNEEDTSGMMMGIQDVELIEE